jgi:hypothetical protein
MKLRWQVSTSKPKIDRLRRLSSELHGCVEAHCKLVLCNELNWRTDAKGFDGEAGLPGQQGGKGGLEGKPGMLSVYLCKAKIRFERILSQS